MSARDALRALAQLGLTARLHGTGVVVEQDPPAGTPLERGVDRALLRLERQASARLASAAQP